MAEPPTEAELTAYMMRLQAAEQSGERQQVVFGPYTALMMIGALQLALRHPAVNEGTLPEQIRAVIDQFRPWFVGTIGEYVIDLGNDPEQDR
jgi:hypothetical protein